jgi:hypothetical protein
MALDRNIRGLICFFAGLLSAVLLAFATPLAAHHQTGTAAPAQSSSLPALNADWSEFAASHLEPNFYQ